MMAGRDETYVTRLIDYAVCVRDGRLPASRWTRLACERHLRDLERQRTDEFPYYFDDAAAMKVCRVAELFPHVKGEWAKRGNLIELEDWECFLLGVGFGWKRVANDTRRFREFYWEIPRKNGKSILGAIIGDFMFIADGEYGAEVYSGATTRKQAWEVYGPARLMLTKSPDICDDAGVQIGAQNMHCIADRSKFEPLIGNPGDGASPSCAIIDEFHEHATSNQYDTMITGMGARRQPLVAIITTAGSSLIGPCYDKHLQAKKVLDGAMQNDELFTIIYTIDEDDDWTDPAVLAKANPNFDISVSGDFLVSQQRQAVQSVEYQNRFKTKHLNVWCSAKTAAINMPEWLACKDESLTIEAISAECEAWLVLDLAARVDLCVRMALFTKLIEGELHYYVFGRYYLPEATINEAGPNSSAYQKWRNQGLLVAVEGNEIDYEQVKDDVVGDLARMQVREVVYDPWRAVHIAQILAREGATCVEYRNTVQSMSLPFKELLSAIKSGRLHHDGDPVLTWAASNVVAKLDAKDNIYPRKEKNEMKIDPIVALIMGIGRAMTDDNGTPDFSVVVA
jgi:phage terminase large subunit-like protein